MPKNVQIRDLDDDVYTTLRSRAAADDLSLTQYLKRELSQLASTPTMAELMERADRRRERLGGGVSRQAFEEVLAEAQDDRQ